MLHIANQQLLVTHSQLSPSCWFVRISAISFNDLKFKKIMELRIYCLVENCMHFKWIFCNIALLLYFFLVSYFWFFSSNCVSFLIAENRRISYKTFNKKLCMQSVIHSIRAQLPHGVGVLSCQHINLWQFVNYLKY